jgi:hypothetical protein
MLLVMLVEVELDGGPIVLSIEAVITYKGLIPFDELKA